MSQSLRGLTNCMFFLAQMILTFTKILLVPFLAKGLFHSLQNLPIGFPNHFSAHNDTSHLDPSNFHMPPEHFVYCKHQNILNIESFHGKWRTYLLHYCCIPTFVGVKDSAKVSKRREDDIGGRIWWYAKALINYFISKPFLNVLESWANSPGSNIQDNMQSLHHKPRGYFVWEAFGLCCLASWHSNFPRVKQSSKVEPNISVGNLS